MKRILAVLALLAVAVGAFAATATTTQIVDITISEVVAIAVNPAGNIALGTVIPTAGDPVGGDSDASTYLQYTVATSAACWISARLNAAMPAGTELHLVAVIGSAGGGGSQGTATAERTLTTSDQTIITAIANCYTGSAATEGANVTYSLVITGGPAPVVTSRTVTLTLTDT